MSALLDISTDTRYLAIGGTPLTQAAVEQLERASSGRDLSKANWQARVVITHGEGDSRYCHDVALGQLKTTNLKASGGKVFTELVALRITDIPLDPEFQKQLRELPFALLMF